MALTNQLDKTKIGLILKKKNRRGREEKERRRRRGRGREEEEEKELSKIKGMELTLGMNSSMDHMDFVWLLFCPKHRVC